MSVPMLSVPTAAARHWGGAGYAGSDSVPGEQPGVAQMPVCMPWQTAGLGLEPVARAWVGLQLAGSALDGVRGKEVWGVGAPCVHSRVGAVGG